MAKKSTIEAWQLEDADRLKNLFLLRDPPLSQQKFGLDFDIGTQGMVWQYLSGVRPLNVEAAIKFAQGLGVTINDFSERLAAQIDRAHKLTRQSSARGGALGSSLELVAETAKEMQILTVYRLAGQDGRTIIDIAVDQTRARLGMSD
ncbi:MAG: hypothetical protein V4684_19410 [Pseudomonadota bacterium]